MIAIAAALLFVGTAALIALVIVVVQAMRQRALLERLVAEAERAKPDRGAVLLSFPERKTAAGPVHRPARRVGFSPDPDRSVERERA